MNNVRDMLRQARLKSVCDSPLKNPSYALNPGDFFVDHSIKKKNQEEKNEEERIAKNATDTNQQLYQKNYHSGPKDKCPETTKKGITKRNMILKRRISRKDSKKNYARSSSAPKPVRELLLVRQLQIILGEKC